MAVIPNPNQQFDLVLKLNHIDVAHILLGETQDEEKDSTDTMTNWKRLSDTALKASLASNDYTGLLLMYTTIGNLDGIEKLAMSAEADGKTNIAFSAYLLTGNIEGWANILVAIIFLAEAAFFLRGLFSISCG